MNRRLLRAASCGILMVLAMLLNGCGGTKVLPEPEPLTLNEPLLSSENIQVKLMLDWVVVRDGPGTWARNADWDQYLLRVQNLSTRRIRILGVTVEDSLGATHQPGHDRKKLLSSTRETARRYRQRDLVVQSGVGGSELIALGVATGAASSGAAVAALYGSTSAAVAEAAVLGLLAAPVLIASGVVRAVNSRQVKKQIELRSTFLPMDLPPGAEQPLILFFPVAPSPNQLELSYADAEGEYTVVLDSREALSGLHLSARP